MNTKDQKNKLGTLYSVALDIGNELDLSKRSIEVLSSVDIIACEDTRFFLDRSKVYNLPQKKLVSYHDHNESETSDYLIQSLEQGKNIALVSDAGTPQISDPGYHIIRKCYEKQLAVKPLPGPSSITAALSVCPIGGKSFIFVGFASSQNSTEFEKELIENSNIADRIIFFESPHRIEKHLKIAHKIYSEEKIFIAREITKKYEEFLFDTPLNLSNLLQNPKGEFVVIYPRKELNKSLDIESEILKRLELNYKPQEILKELKSIVKIERRELYDLITKLKHFKK